MENIYNILNLSIRIKNCKDVYEPHDDTELLLTTILENEADLRGKNVLEIGTGTGIIAVALAKNGANVTATDISERAVACTKMNARRNMVDIRVLKGDLFEPVIDEKFDIIVFNPPYLPEDDLDKYLSPGYRQALIGGRTGSEVIIRFISNLKYYLKKNGRAYVIVSSLSDMGGILKAAEENDLKLELKKQASYFFEKLLVYVISI